MNFDFSNRTDRVEPSTTLAISDLASGLEVQDEDIVDLSVGVSDFPTPDNIMQAAKDTPDAGHTSYTSSNGIPELKKTIAAELHRNGIDAEADEVIVTPGGKQALFETPQTLVGDGGEVVLLDPAWVSYEVMVKLAGDTLSCIDLMQHDFCLGPVLDELADTVSDGTKLLAVNSPSNPTGGVFSDAAFKGVRDLTVEHDIAVISDEIYGHTVYDGFEHTSFGSLDRMKDRIITINDFPKVFSTTGQRLDYLHAPFDLIAQAGELHSHSVSCAVNLVQHAGVEALSERANDDVEETCQAFEDRCDILVDFFAERDVDVAVPKGAFYMILPVDNDDQAWCESVIQDTEVATVPGSVFSVSGYAHISHAASEERPREAVERLTEHDCI